MGVKIKGSYKISAERSSGDFLVRFFDYDGTILKQQWVNSGETATAPTTPTHQYLTFAEWNNDLTNIDSDIDTGAIYNTTDGKSYLFITLTPTLPSGTTINLSITKSSTSLATIDWGDGTTSTSTTSGNQLILHTYPSYGDYIVTVSNLLGGTCYLGAGYQVAAYNPFPGFNSILTKLYVGFPTNGATIGYSLLRNQYSCFYASLPQGMTSMALFGDTSVLKHINLPRGCSIPQNIIASNYNCRYITCNKSVGGYSGSFINSGNGLLNCPRFYGSGARLSASYQIRYAKFYPPQTSVIADAFTNSYSLEIIDLPSTITSVGNTAFNGTRALRHIIFRGETPPTLGTTVFIGISSTTKIYVPDNVVNIYKGASGWIVYANYIYPLSTYVHYRPDLE